MDATTFSKPSSPAALACKALHDHGLGIITTPQSLDYDPEQHRPWSETCWLPAACYVRPQSTGDVAAILSTLKKLEVKFAVRSTGHNPTINSSSVDGSGIVINMRDIKSLSFNENDGTLSAGGGSTWGDVYAFLEECGRSVIGARNFGVGVGGFTLGGGMPAFPNIHGLAADNVRNFEVVLGDSSVVNANAETNPDLWRALKGGGTNFGIVTRFDFETYPLIRTKYAVNLYDPADYVNILRATVEVQESMELDPKIGLFVSFNPTFVAVGLLYADTPAETSKVFDPFLNLQSLISAAVPWTDGTIRSLVASIQYNAPSARRTQAVTATKVSFDLYVKVHEIWLETIKTATAEIFYTIQPLASSAVTEGEHRGGNIMGIKKIAQSWYAFAGFWPDASLDEEGLRSVDDLRRTAEELAKWSGDHLEFHFMNDASPSQTVLESYGLENLNMLREVAAKYDPEKVFQVLQNGGNLLRRLD
ncbi:putative fad linked oxidase-like protein [Eutypa lata UCREL1]|uniref:Putative fad linked oxidase-like protein n=1 Tax=Eutypa lata (strain UCR-EL1) TaxID=1287681 RepID=M7U1Q1_EUTLA|nr:putative fad linked oxidase-like protein [Eutypa lata UCREL1]